MKTIALTNGRSMIVDDEDYEWASKHKWYWSNGYAMTQWSFNNQYGMVVKCPASFHRIVTGMKTNAKNKLHVDHINQDRLDNRRENLRIVTVGENLKNSASRPAPKTFWIIDTKRNRNGKTSRYYRAFLRKNGQMTYGKQFKTHAEALRFCKEYCTI